ncbi:MAG: hypothetical protein WBX25_00780 [Rhodomicrobium sp.]
MPDFGDAEFASTYRSKFRISVEKRLERFREQSQLRGESLTAFEHLVLQILIVLRHRENIEGRLATSETGSRAEGFGPPPE